MGPDDPCINDEGRVPARLRDLRGASEEAVSDIPGVDVLESMLSADVTKVRLEFGVKNWRQCYGIQRR